MALYKRIYQSCTKSNQAAGGGGYVRRRDVLRLWKMAVCVQASRGNVSEGRGGSRSFID